MVFYSVSLKHVLIYIWLSSSSGRGRSIDDQVLDLALIHSPLSCGLLLARCQYLHRSNIVWIGHPTLIPSRDFAVPRKSGDPLCLSFNVNFISTIDFLYSVEPQSYDRFLNFARLLSVVGQGSISRSRRLISPFPLTGVNFPRFFSRSDQPIYRCHVPGTRRTWLNQRERRDPFKQRAEPQDKRERTAVNEGRNERLGRCFTRNLARKVFHGRIGKR